MATTPRDRLDRELAKVADMDAPEATRDAIERFAHTLDKARPRHTATDADDNTYKCEPRTVEAYVRCLRLLTGAGLDPLDCTADDVNAVLDEWHDAGRGKAASTLNGYQAAARAFFRVHDSLGVDAAAIAGFVPDRTPRHDASDVLTAEEVWALREAAGRTRNPTRDRAFLELLVHTGQRIRALATLKTDDVHLSEPAIYLNPEVDGLKGALRRGRRRPIFGARKYVREWIDAHPGSDEGWLFVGDPSHWKTDPSDHWAEVSVDHVFRRMAEDAGVDKDISAHSMRHYCVTVLRRDYERPWAEINTLAGVVEGSTALKDNYSHIDDDRRMRNIEVAMGYAEDETPNRFAPPTCVVCDELMKPEWRQCRECGETYAPGGKSLDETIGERQMAEDDPLRRTIQEAVRLEMSKGGR